MKTSISSRLLPSRSNRMVDAGRGLTISAIRLRSSEPRPEERPLGRVSKDEWQRLGLMVRDARSRAPHHEEFLACRAGLRLQVGATIDPGHARQQVIHLGL